jgi:hypothetical protein
MVTPAPPPTFHAQEYVVLHDARAVHDCAFFPLARLAASGLGTWTVAILVPSPRSGSATTPGAYIDGTTGKLVKPNADASIVVVKNGKWEAVSPGPDQPREGSYSWTEPMTLKRSLTEEDLYSPFAKGGMIVSRRGTGGPTGEFTDVSLIFDQWGSVVEPAAILARDHPKVFQGSPWSNDEIKSAKDLLQDSNDIISAMAFRELVERGLLDSSLLRATLDAAPGIRRAILIYMVLALSPERSKPVLTDDLVAEVATARTEKELESAALAAYTAFIFEPHPPFVMRRARRVVRAITSQMAELGTKPAPNSRMALMLETLEEPLDR